MLLRVLHELEHSLPIRIVKIEHAPFDFVTRHQAKGVEKITFLLHQSFWLSAEHFG